MEKSWRESKKKTILTGFAVEINTGTCVLNITLPGSPSSGPALGFGICLSFKSSAVSSLLEASASCPVKKLLHSSC